MSILDDIAGLVREAGQIVLSARDIWSHTHEKTSAADLVTEYDEAVEAFLKERLPSCSPVPCFSVRRRQRTVIPAGAGYLS